MIPSLKTVAVFSGILALSFFVFVHINALLLKRHSEALILSALRVRSTDDVANEIDYWRKRLPDSCVQTESSIGDGRAFRVQINNSILAHLHLAPNTGMLLQYTTVSGELRQVLLGVFNQQSSVWSQEEFASGLSDRMSIHSEGLSSAKATHALLSFGAGISESKKKSAFAMNANCLVQIGGCHNAQDILPGIDQLQISSAAKEE